MTCISALNAYINYKVRKEYLSVGSGIYPPSDKVIMLSGGAELMQGFSQSLRPGWGKSYNLKSLEFFNIFMLRLI